MILVSEAEATALLSQAKVCPEAPGWSHNRLKPGLATLECGLVSRDGSRAGLHVQLLVGRSTKTGVRTFKFTVFRVTLGAPQRIYQFHINGVAHNPKNWHDEVHEHVGEARKLGAQEWLKWSFDEALDYFCQRANITFVPPIADPEAFELK